MKVVAGFGGIVIFRKINIIKRESPVATERVSVLPFAGKSNFAVDAFRKAGFMEPAVEVISGKDRVVASDIHGEGIAIFIPGVG